MKKFLLYCLGVLNLLFCSVACANEKFEVLPDLPDQLSFVAQSAQAASVTGTADMSALEVGNVGVEPSIISVVLSLLFVVFLIYFTGIIYAKLNKLNYKTLKKQGDLARSQVSVISTTQLGNNKTLHVVELDGKRMLIGASASAIQLIKDLGSSDTSSLEDNYSHIEIPNIKIPKIEIPRIEIPSINFSKLSTKTHKPINELEKSIESDISEDVEKNVSDEDIEKTESNAHIALEDENCDEIIDTLFAQEGVNDTENSEQEISSVKSEHVVDPDDFALYKKYLS